MDQPDVVPDDQAVVVLVSEDLVGPDLKPALLHGLPDVVSPEHDVDAAGAVSTVPSREDPLVRDEGTATEPLDDRDYQQYKESARTLSSMKRAAIHGYWWGVASSPPTILSEGPGRPHSPAHYKVKNPLVMTRAV